MDFNFDEIGLPEDNRKETTFNVVAPGVQPLTVTAVELATSNSGTAAAEVTFANAGGATFKEKFWLSQKAMARIQYLASGFAGSKLTGTLNNETIVAMLSAKIVGKTETVVVDGIKTTKEKDGKVYTNVYPTLRFGGYINPEGKDAEVRYEDKTAAAAPAPVNIFDLESPEDDLPF